MKTVQIVEYRLIDTIGRVRKTSIMGVFDEFENIEKKVAEVSKAHPGWVVHISIVKENHLFC